MNKAIAFLRDKGYGVNGRGEIRSQLPSGLEGIQLVSELEDLTMGKFFCYTIIENMLVRKYI